MVTTEVCRPWSFYSPVRLLAGAGIRRELHKYISGTVLLLTSKGMVTRGTTDAIMRLCPDVSWKVHTVSPNPDVDSLEGLAVALGSASCTAIVALGGGSVVDAAKVLSPLLCAPEPNMLRSWLRTAKPDVPAGPPVFCLPTTAGTGAEVTPFATVWDMKEQKKYSLGHERVFPHTVFLDPELTLGLPWEITLYTALDTLSHALESLWNKNATPVSAPLALEALRLVVAALPQIEENPAHLEARALQQQASLLAGYAISQTRTALAHSMSYPLTAHFDVPHGLACGYTLAALIELVEEQQGWSVAPDNALLESIVSLLHRYAPHMHIFRYCTAEQAFSKLDEMTAPSRAGNFTLDVTPQRIRSVIMRALHMAP